MHPSSLAEIIQTTTLNDASSVASSWPAESIARLKGVLDTQLPLHKLVLEAILTKKVAVLSNNMQAIQEIDSYLKQCQKELQRLEKERLTIIKQHYHAETPFRLEWFIGHCLSPHLSSDELKPWFSLQAELQSILSQIERANQEVGDLLAISMGWVQNSLQALKKATLQQSGQAYTGVTAKGGKGYHTKPKAPTFQTSLHQHEA